MGVKRRIIFGWPKHSRLCVLSCTPCSCDCANVVRHYLFYVTSCLQAVLNVSIIIANG